MKEDEIDVIDRLALPNISALGNELPGYLNAVRDRLNSYIDKLTQYGSELNRVITEVVVLPKLKAAANRIFSKYPEANYIALVERMCSDDDSGNCHWTDNEFMDFILPDLDFNGIEYSCDSDTKADFDELRKLFAEAYPDLTFEGGDNAYWDSRPDQYFGLNRDCEPVFISEYDEDGYSDSDPIYEVIK